MIAFLKKHFGGFASSGVLVTTITTVAAAVKFDVDPQKAISQLGFPVFTSLALMAALGWVFLIYIPRLEEREKRIMDTFERNIEKITDSVKEFKQEIRDELKELEKRVSENTGSFSRQAVDDDPPPRPRRDTKRVRT